MGRISSTRETVLQYLIQHSNFSAKLWLPQLFGYAYLNILRISCIWAILSLDPWLFSREGDFPKQVWTWCALTGWVEMAIIFHWGRSFDLFLSCHCLLCFLLQDSTHVPNHQGCLVLDTCARVRCGAPEFWAGQCGANRHLSSLRCLPLCLLPSCTPSYQACLGSSDWAVYLLKPLHKLLKLCQLIHGSPFSKL